MKTLNREWRSKYKKLKLRNCFNSCSINMTTKTDRSEILRTEGEKKHVQRYNLPNSMTKFIHFNNNVL